MATRGRRCVMTPAARHSWARCMLGLGVAATVGANVAYGLAFGLIGAVISAWPAVAFNGSVELAIGLARAVRTVPLAGQGGPAAALEAARAAYLASVTAGKPLSQRAIARQSGLSRRTVCQLVAQAADG